MNGSLQLHWPKDETEWLGLRKGRMTSSVAAAALGLSPYATPLDAWCAITGRESFEGNKATVRGTQLEPVVLDYPTTQRNLVRKEAAFVRTQWSGDSADCIYAQLYGSTFVGEGKTVAQGGAEGYGAEGTDEVPDHVLIQTCFHLAHHPHTEGGIIPVLIGGYCFEFREYYVARNNDLIGNIMQRCERFHRDYVVTDKAPPASAGDDRLLKYLWKREVAGKFIPPTSEAETLVREYVAAHGEFKTAKEAKGAAGAKLRQLLEDAEGCAGDGWKVTNKYVEKKTATVDWEKVARECGATDETIAQHTRFDSGYRRLLPKLVKPKAPKKVKV